MQCPCSRSSASSSQSTVLPWPQPQSLKVFEPILLEQLLTEFPPGAYNEGLTWCHLALSPQHRGLESSKDLFLLLQTLSRYAFLDPSVHLPYPKEQENHDRIKMGFACCKILSRCLLKAACSSHPPRRVQEVMDVSAMLGFWQGEDLLYPSILFLHVGNFSALVSLKETQKRVTTMSSLFGLQIFVIKTRNSLSNIFILEVKDSRWEVKL